MPFSGVVGLCAMSFRVGGAVNVDRAALISVLDKVHCKQGGRTDLLRSRSSLKSLGAAGVMMSNVIACTLVV